MYRSVSGSIPGQDHVPENKHREKADNLVDQKV